MDKVANGAQPLSFSYVGCNKGLDLYIEFAATALFSFGFARALFSRILWFTKVG